MGVQAVHPDGELAVARAAANRGTAMGLSSFASKPIEDVVAANPKTFFQMYWVGDRDAMAARMERARKAGAAALIATLDWSFAFGRDWGSPHIPERMTLREMIRMAPEGLSRSRWLFEFAKTGRFPDLTVPNLVAPAEVLPTFFGAYGQWQGSAPPSWDDVIPPGFTRRLGG
jgi:isopentenyl diphosphate isomerase/L-lactate dehydrogenase-like FMN-dependent dehydrogenase